MVALNAIKEGRRNGGITRVRPERAYLSHARHQSVDRVQNYDFRPSLFPPDRCATRRSGVRPLPLDQFCFCCCVACWFGLLRSLLRHRADTYRELLPGPR